MLLKLIEETLKLLKYEESVKSQDHDKLFNGLKELQKALQKLGICILFSMPLLFCY